MGKQSVIIKPRTNHGEKGIIKIDNYEQFLDFYIATKAEAEEQIITAKELLELVQGYVARNIAVEKQREK